MASNESAESIEELNSPTTAAMPSENLQELSISKETETEIENESAETSTATTLTTSSSRSALGSQPRSAAYRGVRFAPAEAEPDDEEDSWWWEVENENLTLDQVPNVTSVFTPSPEDILEQPTRAEEAQNAILEEEFESLHRIANRIKNTMNEQRERHLSESSDKSLSEHSAKSGRERHLSESSEKSLSDPVKLEAETAKSDATAAVAKEQSLEEFKEELRLKRLTRQSAVQGMRDEMATLRKQLEREREISRRLRNGEKVEESSLDFPEPKSLANKSLAVDLEGATSLCSKNPPAADDDDDANPLSRSRHANIELANCQLALQMANSENFSLRGELDIVQKQVASLKDVIACCKQMLTVKEEQCNELKQRLTEIEKSFAEHEMKIMSDNLRQEYERQLVNIRQLRQLYEERQRVAAAEYENLQRLISIKRDELGQEQEKTKELEERNQNMLREIETANNELACLRDECKEHRFEKAALKEEMGAVNTLFSQMVMGFNGKNNLDIDRLTTMLEENRTLLNDMATKECTDGATLPKLLFELVEQASVGEQSIEKSSTPCQSPIVDKEVMLQPENNAKAEEMEEEETSTSQAEEEDADDVDGGELAVENDNENMALVGNDNNDGDTVALASASMYHHPQEQQQQQQQQPENIDDTSSTPSVDGGDASTDAAVATNEKVSVTLQQTKSKKQHHSHHRKGSSASGGSSNSSSSIKKATTSSSSNVNGAIAADADAGAAALSLSSNSAKRTMKFNESVVMGKVTSTQEIIGNLPKVWRVLMELLNHHHIDPVQFEENGKGEDCYKSVETPQGPKAELSVSKTYLKLKDLILEKKSLVKETNRLKTLNCHLDYRLNEQEKRLSAVSLELTKTWHLVGKMQRQHRQLHTQEQILRYQLQQKRRLLHELKDELEYCRRKWQAARAKNDESQEQCNDLRREFARRKLEDANNSAESGYSDSGGPVSDEEPLQQEKGSVGGVQQKKVGSPDDEGDDEVDGVADAAMTSSTSAGGCVNYRRKRLREMFEHTRKIKRMQSTSPGRAEGTGGDGDSEVLVLRWNSAPPTCGWRGEAGVGGDGIDTDEEVEDDELELTRRGLPSTSTAASARGAIPKPANARASRRPQRRSVERSNATEIDLGEPVVVAEAAEDRAFRIQRLEEQCKNLIQQVLETSDNRERLEVQLKRFQDEMSPVQYAVPLGEIMNKKRVDRMTRASSAPASGVLTPREEEYTRRRSERLGRLEEESRQLLFRIKRTSDKGHYLRCSLDRIRRAPASREGSFESNTEEEARKSEEETAASTRQAANGIENTTSTSSKSPLTSEEEAYTARRAARLQRLEEESKQLLTKLSRNNQRSDSLGTRLDTLHERHGSQEETQPTTSKASRTTSTNSPLAASATATATAPGKLTTEQRIENIEKISSNREQRLRILEEEGRQLINRLSETSEKGTQMINRINERELTRQNRSTSTPQRDTDAEAAAVDKADATTVDPLLPTLKNVACSSIVTDELTERVTITTTPSQIAAHQGAIPKTKHTAELLAARPKSARLQSSASKKKSNDNKEETLEEMVRRLQALPFPNETKEKSEELDPETKVKAQNESASEDPIEKEQEVDKSSHDTTQTSIARENAESANAFNGDDNDDDVASTISTSPSGNI